MTDKFGAHLLGHFSGPYLYFLALSFSLLVLARVYLLLVLFLVPRYIRLRRKIFVGKNATSQRRRFVGVLPNFLWPRIFPIDGDFLARLSSM